jgi:ABC-type lipoprotein release transport system permease subunit
LWLPGVVLAVSLGFSLLGVLLPSARASRLIPADALRRRE